VNQQQDAVTVPDVAEPIIGWRYWRLDRHRRQLASLTGHTEVWPVRRAFQAACRYARRDPTDIRYQFVGGFKRARHDAPEEGCTCGIYAARDLKNLRAKMLFGLGLMVVGEVAMWGKVIPGTRGYRAQFAYPRRLYVVQRTADWDQSSTVRALGVYGVPVEAIAHRDVGTRPVDVLAVTLATIGDSISAFGEAIAGFVKRGAAPERDPAYPELEGTESARRMQ
jgi:hypothetical protein